VYRADGVPTAMKYSGYSSVNFNGLLLGNPVTGKYEVATDCAMNWSLQDDSGAFQHSAAAIKAGTNRVEFHQQTPHGRSGILMKTAETCKASIFARTMLHVVGSFDSLATGGDSIDVSAKGSIHVDAEVSSLDPDASPGVPVRVR